MISDINKAEINAIESSGMERSMICIALKMALRKVNNKSKCDMVLLDEIMGKLIDESVEQFIELLNNIKQQVDKVIIIEHIHDVNPDYVIDVSKDKNGISKFELIK
jgi:DNA repair exonuclease SbcCD ATPase subunit